MRMPEHFAGTPRAMEWATASCNQGDRTLTMVRFPCREVLVHVQGISIRPRQRIEVGNGLTRRRSTDAAFLHKHDSSNILKVMHSFLLQPGDEFFERQLTFVRADNIDAARKVSVAPLRRIRATNNDELDAVCFRNLRQTKHVFASDNVCVQADDTRPNSSN